MKTAMAFTLGIVITVSAFVCMGFTPSEGSSRISDYKIIEAENRIQELEAMVQSEIQSGWVPVGGISVSNLPRGNENVVYLHQSMVKY